MFQVPVRRVMYQTVSSGKLAYQIKKYWQNAMYVQKTTKPKSSLPRSCKCSIGDQSSSTSRLPRRARISRIKAASELTSEPAQT